MKRIKLFEEFVTEVITSPTSGTKAGWITSLEDRKYELKKPVKGVKIGSFINQTLPKGTIIHNLPGGVFAMHPELEDKFKLTYSSQAPRWHRFVLGLAPRRSRGARPHRTSLRTDRSGFEHFGCEPQSPCRPFD